MARWLFYLQYSLLTLETLIYVLVYGGIAAVFCKLFHKMGEKWWSALIPGYNSYIFFRHTWKDNWPLPMFFSMIITLSHLLIPPLNNSNLMEAAVVIVNIIISFITCFNFYAAFDRGVGFIIFGIFLPPIALPICAFNPNFYYSGSRK